MSATDGTRHSAFIHFLKELKQAARDGHNVEVSQGIRSAVSPTLDYTSAEGLCRLYRRIKPNLPSSARRTKIAVLASFTANQLVSYIELFLFALGLEVELHVADFGTFRQEILDPDSELYRFEPEIVFIATTWHDLGHIPNLADEPSTVADRWHAEVADWSMLWQTAHTKLGCQIIQNNFAPPPWRVLGNHEKRHIAGLARFIGRTNESLADSAPPYVTIHDVDHLSANVGRREWGDERFYHVAKIPCGPEHLVDYGHSVASLIGAQLGKSKKCLVLDLDNTLWGGVIGDEGLGGIRIGQGNAEGEAFVAFQRYALALSERGVILAVCSKNEDTIAREVFEKHTEMVLRLENISCFVANWNDKAANLRMIAETLNIGLNSIVFVDDNPAERALVRQFVPEVAVPEIPLDPQGYIEAIDRQRYFETISLGGDDFKRTLFYRENAERQHASADITDLATFLASLQMAAVIEPINGTSLDRSVQLINKSNQFNLTTRRYSTSQVMTMIEDEATITRTVKLSDRFGDNGLISVLVSRVEGRVLVIDTWLMSCRVLKRGVESLLMNHLESLARNLQLQSIRGEYIATEKNMLVKDHYEKLGFARIRNGTDDHTHWELTVGENWQPREHFIREIAADE